MQGRKVAALACAAVLASACATLTSRTSVREIGTAAAPARLTSVAVVAIDRDANVRRLWEDEVGARIAARGVAATKGEGLLKGANIAADAVTVGGAEVLEAARRSGAQAILFVRPPGVVPPDPSEGAYRWLGARSGPDPRGDLDTTPASVTEVRLSDLSSGATAWRAMVLVRFPRGNADAGEAADAIVSSLARRGFL